MDADLGQPERPRYAAALTEDLLIGAAGCGTLFYKRRCGLPAGICR